MALENTTPTHPVDEHPGLPDDRLISVSELARMLNISPQTLYAKLNEGSLGIPAIRLGPRTTRFALKRVRDFLENEGGESPDAAI